MFQVSEQVMPGPGLLLKPFEPWPLRPGEQGTCRARCQERLCSSPGALQPLLLSICEDITTVSCFCPALLGPGPGQLSACPLTYGLKQTALPKDRPSPRARPAAFHVPQPVPSLIPPVISCSSSDKDVFIRVPGALRNIQASLPLNRWASRNPEAGLPGCCSSSPGVRTPQIPVG